MNYRRIRQLFSIRALVFIVLITNFLFASLVHAEFQVITVPKNPLKPAVPHSAYNGRQTVFKAICRETTATQPPGVSGTIYYEWDFNGDGVFDTGTLSTTNPYNLEAVYTYPSVTKDELKIAVIRVRRSSSTTWESYGSYPVWIYSNVPSVPNSGTTFLANDVQFSVMRDVAIDDGLWWLHKHLTSRSGSLGTITGMVPRTTYGSRPVSSPGREVAANAAIMWAFQIQGHLAAYPPGTSDVPALNTEYWENDPYAETVCRMLNYVLSGLGNETVPTVDEGDDGTTPIAGTNNGIGLCARAGASGRTYDTAVVLGGLSLCGLQGTTAKVGNATYVKNRKIEVIIQELVDWLVMDQNDSGNPIGGWYYQPVSSTDPTYMDASTAQWAYIGLEAAEKAMGSYGVYVNKRCKHRIPYVMQNNQYLVAGDTNYGAARYRNNSTSPNFQLTGGAIAACAWLGWDTFPLTGAGSTDQPYTDQGFNLTKAQCRQIYDRYLNFVSKDVNWLADMLNGRGQYNNGDWWSSNHQGGTYSMYSIQKGLRTLTTSPTYVGTHNWFYEYSTYYINNQDKSMSGSSLSSWYGSWHDDTADAYISYQHLGTDMSTAFGILILTPSVFESKPIAYAEARPMAPVEGCSGGSAGQVTFYHDQSFTVDPKRTINYYKYFFNVPAGTAYETLDWDNPDYVVYRDPNAEPVWTYQYAGTYKAVLRVEDDNPTPQYSYYVIDGITVQQSENIAPSAVISAVSPTTIVSQVVTMKVDGVAYLTGENSTDPNIACLDTLTYAWDIDGNGFVTGPAAKTIDVDQAYSLSNVPYPVEKVVQLRVTDSAGLTDVKSVTLRIYGLTPAAIIDASPNPVACNSTVAFDGLQSTASIPGTYSIVEYQWDFGDGNTTTTSTAQVNHQYALYGTYNAKLRVRDSDGASNWSTWDDMDVDVSLGKQSPQADAGGPYVMGSGETLATLDASASSDPDTGCGGGIVSYEWDIDGDGDYDENISGIAPDISWTVLNSLLAPVQYADPFTNTPSYTVTVRVTDQFGATNTDNATLYIYNNRPLALLDSVNPAACNEVVTIDASASYHGYPQTGHYIAAYTIDFDDGTSVSDNTLQFGDTIPTVTHSYDQYGTYTVTLTVQDDSGTVDSTSINIEVNQGNIAPVAHVGGPYEINANDSLQLDASASDDSNIACGDVLSFAWDLNNDGVFDDAIGQTPNLSWGSLPAGLQYPTNPLTGLPSNPVKVQVTDMFGATSVASTVLRIYGTEPIAVLNASPNPAGCGQQITFSAADSTHEDPRRSILQYSWDFDLDGSYDANGQTVTHSFDAFGTYTVALRVTDDLGHTDEDQINVFVTEGNVAPTANPNGPYIMNEGEGLTLHGTATDPNSTCETILTYEWDLNGDGDYNDSVDKSGSDPVLTWADIQNIGWLSPADPATGEPKNLIRLRVTDTLGLTGERTTYVRIYHDAPYAVLMANPQSAACNETVTFDARSSYHGRPDKSISSYEWDLDNDGLYDDASGAVVTFAFTEYGDHEVGLKVSDSEGQFDTAFVVVDVSQGNIPPVAVIGGPYEMEIGDSITFDASGSSDPNASCGDYILSYDWDIDSDGVYDFTTSSSVISLTWAQIDVANIDLVYPADPSSGVPYTPVTLRVTDSLGLSGTQNGILRIYANSPVADFDVIPQVVPIPSNGQTVFTLDASDSYHTSPYYAIVQYQWDLGNDGSVECTETNAVTSATYSFANVTEETIVNIKLTVTDNNDPAKTDTKIIAVLFQPPPTPPSADLKVLDSVGGTETSVIELGYGAVLDGSGSIDPDMGAPYYDFFKRVEWDINGDGVYDVVRDSQDTNGDTQIDYNDDPVDLVLDLSAAELTSYGITPGVAYTTTIRITDSWDKQDTDTAVWQIVGADVVAELRANPNPAGCQQTVTLDASMSHSTFLGRTIVQYEWDLNGDSVFGDDGIATPTTTVSFASYDIYTVRVRVTDDVGVSAIDEVTIQVNQGNSPPVADAGGPYIFNYNESFILNGSGSDIDFACGGGVTSYAWDLDGDGVFDDAITDSPTINWNDFVSLQGGSVAEGLEYVIRLQVTDALGLTGVHSSTVEFYNNEVVAQIETFPNPAACGADITIDAGASYNTHPSYDVVQYEWDFDYNQADGFDVEQSGGDAQITHSFNAFATYRVAVRAIDNNSPARSDIAFVDIVINQGNLAPIANTGGPYMQEFLSDVLLDASASIEPDVACGDTILEYAWDIDNNGSFEDPVDIKTASAITTLPWNSMSSWPFNVPQTIQLRVTDMFGLQTIKSTTVTIYENDPIAIISSNLDNAACNQVVTFDASASFHTYPARELVTYRWDFDYDGGTPEWDCEGTPSTADIVTHAYNQYGTYIVLLQVVDNNDPAKTSIDTVTIYVDQGNQNPIPVIGGALQISVNANLQLNGTQSTDPNASCGDFIKSYEWDIDGDGDFDENITGEIIDLSWSEYQAMVDYPTDPVSGTPSNTIRLRVTDSLDAQAIKTAVLRIYDNAPVSVFTAAPNPAQCNQSVTFDASGSYHENPINTILTYRWDFDYDGVTPTWDAEGTQSTHQQVTFAYNQYGSYDVLLQIEDDNIPAQTDTYTFTVSVDPTLNNLAPIASHGGPYVLSQGDSLTLDGSGSSDPDQPCGDTIIEYAWDLDGDGNYDGANDVTGVTPTIPWASIAALNLPVADPVTQSPVNSIGIRVTDAQGATATARTQLRIYINEPVAIARASSQQISCDQSVTLSADMSYHQHPGHSIVNYEWDFEDDGTFDASGIDVTHKYLVYGSHTARLRVMDDQGKIDETTVSVTLTFVNVAPVANPGGPYTTSILAGSAIPVALDATRSSDPNAPCDSVVEYAWDTDGDGLFGTDDTNGVDLDGDLVSDYPTDYVGANVSYANQAWQRGVSYVVKLKVKDSLGVWSDAVSTQIEVQNSPPPALTLVSPDGGECLRGTTQIQFRVSDPEGEVVTVTATVGGSTIGSKNIDTPNDGSVVTDSISFNTTTLADGTNYKVLLEAEDTGGGTSSDDSAAKFTIDNTAPAAPTVAVPVQGACYVDLAPAHDASSTDNTTANPTITRVDSNDGCNWTSTFTATDDCGNQSSPTVVTYHVSDSTLSIVFSGVVEGTVYPPGTGVTYTHSSNSNCVTSISAVWSKEGGLQSQPYISGDLFNDPGTYTVFATVANICGDAVTDSVQFVINDVTFAEAGGPYNGTEGVEVPLSASNSYDPEGLPLTYEWDLDGDGEFDDAYTMDTSVQFDENGTYTVYVKVTDSLGAWSIDSAQVIITNTAPVVDAGDQQTVDEGDTVTFAGSFTDVGDESFTHIIQWSFGDGDTASDSLEPTHVYGDNGTYTATLTVTDDDGAIGSDTITVIVGNVDPTVSVDSELLENEGEPLEFTAIYTDPGSLDTHTVTVDWGDGDNEQYEISGGSFTGAHTYLYKGTYTVTVTVEDDDGGEGSQSFDVTIGRIPLDLNVVIEDDLSATISFNGIQGKDYDIYCYEGDIMNYTDINNWTLMETVTVTSQGSCNDAGDPGDDGLFGTVDDVRQAPIDVPVRYYRVVETGTIDAGDPWASGQIGYYQTCSLFDGRNFIGKTGCADTLDEAIDRRFMRLGYDVELMHQGIKVDYMKDQAYKKAYVYDANGFLLWTDGNIDVTDDSVVDGAGFLITLNPGMGPRQLPMAGVIETRAEIVIDILPSYTLVTWPYANEVTLEDSGLLESGFRGDIRARTADMIYFWNPATQAYDLPVFYFTGTGEWRNYDQSPCTHTLKPGESFMIRLSTTSGCTEWRTERKYQKPTYNLQP